MSVTSLAKDSALDASDEQASDVSMTFLDTLTGFQLRQVSNAFMSDFAASMSGTGLRPVHVSILSIIEENPGIRQGEIGRALGVARANMAPLMAELENMKLLRRNPDAADRRAMSIDLTVQGASVLKNCKARIAAHERRALEPLTKAEQETLLRLLKKL